MYLEKIGSLFWSHCIAFGTVALLSSTSVVAQSLPPIYGNPAITKFTLGMHYKQAEKLANNGFRPLGSTLVMGGASPPAAVSANFTANRRTGLVTRISSLTEIPMTVEQVIAYLPNYTRSIAVEPGTLLDSIRIRPDNLLPSVILCTKGSKYAYIYQNFEADNFHRAHTSVGIVDLSWLESQLNEYRDLKKKFRDYSKKDVKNICKSTATTF
jgi:hypothetical protein